MSGDRSIFVIFGAPVLPGGVPSPALERRIRSALRAAEHVSIRRLS